MVIEPQSRTAFNLMTVLRMSSMTGSGQFLFLRGKMCAIPARHTPGIIVGAISGPSLWRMSGVLTGPVSGPCQTGRLSSTSCHSQ